MNQFGANENYSLLNEKKKAQIMEDIRKEIDKQKAQYSMNNDQFNDVYNNSNYNNMPNINNSNFKNDNYINKQQKYTYECNDEINNNDLEKSDANKEIESDDEEEHLQILNNAKNVLNQIQDDINKFSEAYGIQNILKNNESISSNNNPISEPNSNYNNYYSNNDSNYENSNNNKNIYIDNNEENYEENNYDENNNDNGENDEEDENENNIYENENNNYESDNNIHENENNNYQNEKNNYQNEDNNYENEEEYNNYDNKEENNNYENEDNEQDNDDKNNLNEINNNNININLKKNKNTSIKLNDYNDYKNVKLNTLYQHNNYSNPNLNQEDKENINDEEYLNYLDEEQPRKYEFINDYINNNSNIKNNTNNNNKNSIPNENSSKSKYNFENPLNYDKENMKNNFKKYSNYSNYINQKNNKSYEEEHQNNENKMGPQNKKRKTKSTTKPQIRLTDNDNNNNIDKNEYMNKISKVNNPKYKNNKKNNNKGLNISNDNLFSIKNKEKFQNIKKELENKFAEAHPFKPKVNKKYNETKINEETEEERYNRLSRPKILDINEKKRIKDLEELKKISENNIVKPGHKVNPKEVSNRLYSIHQQMKMKKDKIKQNYEENQNKEYSFTPEINSYSKVLMDKYQKKPIYERNEEFEKQKTDNIIRMRKEIEKEQKERCKPSINEKSRKLAEQNRYNNKNGNNMEYQDVYERLYKENINKDTKSLGYRDMKECTFAPKLNPMSNYLLNNNNDDVNNENEDYNENLKDFLERQRMYEELKKEKLQKNKINNNTNYTFKPEINSNSDLLAKCNPDRYGLNNNDKYNRLYEDAQRIKMKKEKLENELNNQYDFIPKINELSKYIGRKPDFEELNNIQENKIYKQMIKKEEEEYDFKPQIYNNNKYKNIQSNYKNDNNMLERINEEVQNKNKKIKMMQKIKENKDIEQCNFMPEINKDVPDFENNKPMYMKGMARYLGQMEKARQAKRDKEQREREVFLTGEGWNKNNGITVPKPFKLSYQNNKKMEMMKKEREKEEKKDYYYNAKTNESKNREIIKKLLNEN